MFVHASVKIPASTLPTRSPIAPKTPCISTFAAALGEVLALAAAASAEPLGAAVAEALPPSLRLEEPESETEDEVIRAGPLEVDEVELDEALALTLELELALAFADGLAAKLALPPPMVDTGVHCEVAPAG